jgi:nicotinate-nucleotide pyrophosphorylase (carboxylating)
MLTDDYIRTTVATALAEDIGSGDLTAQLIPAHQTARATIITREPAVLCGQRWVNEVFRQIEPQVHIEWLAADGQQLHPGQALCHLQGPARALLTGERTALNFLQTLSGTATLTQRHVARIAGTGCRILDTRKTVPGLRLAQKYAVTCGGGTNHRIGLFDAMLVKENHIAAAGSIAAAVTQGRALNPAVMLEVEVETLDELHQALAANVDRILLDNFSVADLRTAVGITRAHINAHIELEASGNMTLDTLRDVAETGVDFISIGGLTKHVSAVDLSMRLQ